MGFEKQQRYSLSWRILPWLSSSGDINNHQDTPPSFQRRTQDSVIARAKAEQARAAAGSVAGISAPEVAVANIPATATRLSVPETVAETDCDCTGLACDPWLQEEHKKALVALLRDYYTVGLGVGGGGPEQAEIVSVLAAKLITYTR